VAQAFNPSRLGRGRRISEFKASLVFYRVSSRTVRATQRNPVSKNQKKKKKKKRKEMKRKLRLQMKTSSLGHASFCLAFLPLAFLQLNFYFF
jgi:hypothetical protein